MAARNDGDGARGFVPGLVLGLVVGAFAGAVLPPLLTGQRLPPVKEPLPPTGDPREREGLPPPVEPVLEPQPQAQPQTGEQGDGAPAETTPPGEADEDDGG